MEQVQPRIPHFRRTRRFCGAVLAVLGATALLGWLTGWHVLARTGFDSIPMAPNTALAFLALGTGLCLLARTPLPRWMVWSTRLAAGLVAVLVVCRLGEFLLDLDLGTDRWIVQTAPGQFADAPLGHMAYQTALSFLVASVTLFWLTFPSQGQIIPSVPGYLAVAVAALGLIFALGYLYGTPLLAQRMVIPMALNTSLAFVLLGVGLTATAGPAAEPLRHLYGPSVAARLLRAFLPFTGLIVCGVAWLMHMVSRQQTASSAALVSAVLAVAALFLVSFICMHIARRVGGELEWAARELQEAERQSRISARQLQALTVSLEQRVTERTVALEESRDRLDQFFSLSTALQDPNNIERAFDLVLRFCQRQGYDLAMLSLVDSEARVIRAVRAAGALTDIVGQTVRALDSNDILAVVVREGQTAVIPQSVQDPRCEQTTVAATGICGQIIVPLVSDHRVFGTLQVASRGPLTPGTEEIRTLETLAGQAARALAGLLHVQEVERLNRQLEERNLLLQQLADDLAATAHAERQAREAWRESEERIRLIVDSAYDAFVAMDATGRITDWNHQAEVTFGWSRLEAIGRSLQETIIPPQYREAHQRGLQRFLATGEGPLLNRRVEIAALHRDGHEFPVELRIAPVRWHETYVFSSFLHDITDRKRAEEALQRTAAELTRSNQQLQQLAADLQQMVASERQAHDALKQTQSQLIQSEKLAALGQLVAGVAHEINNPLSFVSNNVAVLQRDVRALREVLAVYQEAEDLIRQYQPALLARLHALAERHDLVYTLVNLEGLLNRSRDGLKRIQQIVKDLRDFARLDESDLQEVDLNAGIASTINIIQGQAKKQQVALELDLAPLPPVTCYPAKINQVVLNLVANAIDASAAGSRVTVSTRPSGDSVDLVVADTGSGIDPAIRDKIFDPFFTTKPQGRGTGLGLSISYGIVQAHGGTIDFDSAPGQGTRFRVRLPRTCPPGRSNKAR